MTEIEENLLENPAGNGEEKFEKAKHLLLVSRSIEEEAKGNKEKARLLIEESLLCEEISAASLFTYARLLQESGEQELVIVKVLDKAEEVLVEESGPVSLALEMLSMKKAIQHGSLDWIKAEKTLQSICPEEKEAFSALLEPVKKKQEEFSRSSIAKIRDIFDFSQKTIRKALGPFSLVYLISTQSLEDQIAKGLIQGQKAALSALPLIEKSLPEKNMLILKKEIKENQDFICIDQRTMQKLWEFFDFPILERQINAKGEVELNPVKIIVTIGEKSNLEGQETRVEGHFWSNESVKKVILESLSQKLEEKDRVWKKIAKKYEIIIKNSKETLILGPNYHKKTIENLNASEIHLRLLPTRKLHRNGGKMGLKNLGNTCFLNSALQCVLHVSELRDFFLSGDFEYEINTKNVNGSGGQLVWAFYNLILKSWEMGEKTADPIEIIKTIRKVSSTFAGFQQQDSQEFLGYFLDTLHEDLNRVKQKKYEEAKDYKGSDVPSEIQDAWGFFLRRNDSRMVDLFYGQFASYTKCPVCPKVSFNYDAFNMLTLPLIETENFIQIYFFPYDRSKGNASIKAKYHPSVPLRVFLKQLAAKTGGDHRNFEIVRSLDKKLVNEFSDDLPFCELYKNIGARIVYETMEKSDNIDCTARVFIDHFCKGERVAFERIIRVPLNSSEKQFWQCVFPTIEQCLIASEVLSKEEKDQERKIKFLTNSGIVTIRIDQKKVEYTEGPVFPKDLAPNQKISATLTLSQSFPVQKSGLISSINDFKLEDGSSTDLQGLVFCSQREHTLDKDNMWYCNQCKEHREANRKIGIARLPKVLIFNFNRFQTVSTFQFRGLTIPRHQKLSTPVKYPLEDLDMRPFLEPSLQKDQAIRTVYRLIGVINHYGAMGGGHYKATGRVGEEWFDFDDSRLSPISKEEVVSPSAYLLFYELA